MKAIANFFEELSSLAKMCALTRIGLETRPAFNWEKQMENVRSPATKEDADLKRAELRARLQREFHIAALFIPVKTVASVLGLSPSTIYAYIRTDSFFLPYRLINKTPMIALDDLVEWCLRCSSPRCTPPFKTPSSLVSRVSPVNGNNQPLSSGIERISAVDRAVAETMAQLGLAPVRRSPRGR